MPKTHKIIQSFGAGELSGLMADRSDQQKHVAGCRIMENFFPLVYGGAQRRPGLEYIATQSATAQNAPGDDTAKGRMVAFERSISNVYTLCFENQKIRVFKSGNRVMNTSVNVSGFTKPAGVSVVTTAADHGYSTGDVVRFDGLVGPTEANYNGNHATEYTITVITATTFSLDGTAGATDFPTAYTADDDDSVATVYEIITPYLTADIPDLKVEHSADVMYITHDDYEPRKLSRTGDTNWTFEVTDYRTGPFRDQNVDTAWTITPSGTLTLGGATTLTSSKALFVDGVTAGHKASSPTISISAFASHTFGTSTLVTTSAAHLLSTADIVQITGTTSYDGQWNITKVAADTFYILMDYVANDATGEVTEVVEKAHTGALFDIIQTVTGGSVIQTLTNEYGTGGGQSVVENTSWAGPLRLKKNQKWDLTTLETWTGTLKLERNETLGAAHDAAGWEVVHIAISADNKNISASETEEIQEADYRLVLYDTGDDGENCEVKFYSRSIKNHGIVEITGYTSVTVATGIVKAAVDATTATSAWAEGAWSNYRGWPKSVTMSPEDRLIFAGNSSEPLNVWGSEIGDWINYLRGTDDSDPITFSLVGSGQQNEIQWSVPKASVVLGTVGGEHLLGASKDSEALTPTNVQAKLQTTYGSENIRALIVNQAILFVQRGGRKIREFLYNYEADAHKADDLTVFAEHITKSGIVDMAFQRTPDPMLWCVRNDGVMAIMTYERDQNVFSWARVVTDGLFESVAIVYGGVNSEDEVWVTVKRTINNEIVRYVERFTSQKFTYMGDFVFLDGAKLSDLAYTQNNVNNASDTVRCNDGSCNNGLAGGVAA